MQLFRFHRSLYWAFCFEMKTPISETHLIDCIEYMKLFPNNHFELAVVDPPYGIGVNHNIGRRKGQKSSGYKKAYWDCNPPQKTYFIELQRVSVNQIIWGANHFVSLLPAQDSPCWLMWDKMFSEEVTFAQFELAWTSFNSTCKKFVLSPNQIERIHPTQKPVALYKWIFANYAKQGDKILDTHLGSQSSRIAAYEMGFDFYGCELDHEYFEQGNKRFEDWRKMNGQQLFDFNDFVI